MRTLILHARYTRTLSYYDDWLEAFLRDKAFDCEVVDICEAPPDVFATKIGEFELIVLLHSTNADGIGALKPFFGLLENRRGRLLIFPGNEVNLYSVSMAERLAFFSRLEPDIIATQLLEEAGRWLYNECVNTKIISLPHALNPEVFRPQGGERPIDIGARTHRYPPFLGDDDRNRMLDFFLHAPVNRDLVVDIRWDPASRLDRKGWAAFLNRCKGTPATEAGSFYLQKDDRLVNEIQAYLEARHGRKRRFVVRKGSWISRGFSRLPYRLQRGVQRLFTRYSGKLGIRHENLLFEEVSFQEVYQRFFAGRPPSPVYTKAISSRHFDAIGTKTCLVMFPGRYNDILRPDEHYILLRKDFSNIKEVKEKVLDENFRRELVDRTYEYVLQNHTHAHRIDHLKTVLKEI